jgi:hypothetical protein
MAEADPAAADAGGAAGERAQSRPPRLVVWSLATFHTAFLLVLGVAALHLAGVVGDALAGLGTWAGIALYLVLWATTWWTTRRWLGALDGDPFAGRADVDGALWPAAIWGGVDGVLFFLVLLAVLGAQAFARAGVDVLSFLAVAAVVGGLLAFAVGSVAGLLLGSFDLLALRVAGGTASAPESSTPK